MLLRWFMLIEVAFSKFLTAAVLSLIGAFRFFVLNGSTTADMFDLLLRFLFFPKNTTQ